MNAHNKNQKLLNNSESGPGDNIIMASEGRQIKRGLKKFKATTVSGIEYFIAPSLDVAESIYRQINPFRPLLEMEEISNTY